MYTIVVKATFKKPQYSVTEGKTQKKSKAILMVLSNPSSTEIIVKVEVSGGTATGT